MKLQICALAASCVLLTTPAFALPPTTPITYVDATDGPTGNTRLATGGEFNAPRSTAPIDGDNMWTNRTFANNATVFTSSDFGVEDAPGLVTLIDGLVPAASYNVYAYLWVDNMPNSNWRLKASLTQMPPLANDPSVSFSFRPTASTTVAPPANAADFITPPLLFDGNRMLLQASLGQINANASGHINVWIDDFVGSPTANRSWYDGLGYALAIPEPAPLSPVASAILALALRRNTKH